MVSKKQRRAPCAEVEHSAAAPDGGAGADKQAGGGDPGETGRRLHGSSDHADHERACEPDGDSRRGILIQCPSIRRGG